MYRKKRIFHLRIKRGKKKNQELIFYMFFFISIIKRTKEKVIFFIKKVKFFWICGNKNSKTYINKKKKIFNFFN